MRPAIAGAAAVAAGAVAVFFALKPAVAPNEAAGLYLTLFAEARAEAMPGDVVFKKGPGFWGGLAARFSENADGYGHVGIVARDAEGALIVIHAGGDPVSRNGRVQKTGFEDFLGASKAAALYRPRLGGTGAALLYAEEAVARGAPFDADFSLDTEDALYCTELVWRSLSAALGEDAVPDKSTRSGKVYIAIDDLQESPWLAPAWRFGTSDRSI